MHMPSSCSNLVQACAEYRVACRVPHNNPDAANLDGCRLEQLACIPLAGLVESMAVLRGRSSSQKDALLLTFRSTPNCMVTVPLTSTA